jgi:predicted nucleotidyltransferase
LFGSYVKYKQTSESDVDILVKFSEAPGFIEYMELENYISDKLNIGVDLVMEDARKHNTDNCVKEEAILVGVLIPMWTI